MLKWLVTLFIVLVVVSVFSARLRGYGLGRLPGDLRIPARGRVYYIPFTTTVLLSVAVYLLGRII